MGGVVYLLQHLSFMRRVIQRQSIMKRVQAFVVTMLYLVSWLGFRLLIFYSIKPTIFLYAYKKENSRRSMALNIPFYFYVFYVLLLLLFFLNFILENNFNKNNFFNHSKLFMFKKLLNRK